MIVKIIFILFYVFYSSPKRRKSKDEQPVFIISSSKTVDIEDERTFLPSSSSKRAQIEDEMADNRGSSSNTAQIEDEGPVTSRPVHRHAKKALARSGRVLCGIEARLLKPGMTFSRRARSA